MPLCGSQTSLSLHGSPICLAQLLQQPHPSRTALTPGAQWGLSRHLQGHWQNCRLLTVDCPPRGAISCPLSWALLKYWVRRGTKLCLLQSALLKLIFSYHWIEIGGNIGSILVSKRYFKSLITLESFRMCWVWHSLLPNTFHSHWLGALVQDFKWCTNLF